MSTVISLVGAATSTDASSYTTASFTPVQGDLLICNILASNTTTTGYVVDTQSLGWTLISSINDGTNILMMYKSQRTANATAMTVTWDCSDDPATGTRVGVLALRNSDIFIRQFAVNTGGAGTTPSITFPAAVLTANACIGQVGNISNPAAITPTTGWTEIADAGWNIPTTGFQIQRINSGETNSVINWGSVSATEWIAMGIEVYNLDTFPYVGSANMFHNDEVVNFLRNNGFPKQYNDGLRAYLRTRYRNDGSTLNDLIHRYINEFGEVIPPGA